MDWGTGSGEHCGNDRISAANRYYFAIAFLWWDKHDVYRVLTWFGLSAFVLYWKGGKK